MNWQEVLSFLVGLVAFPVVIAVLQKFNPEPVVSFIISWLNAMFSDKEKVNAVSNILGARMIVLGLSLISGVDDDKEIVEILDEIRSKTVDLVVKLKD